VYTHFGFQYAHEFLAQVNCRFRRMNEMFLQYGDNGHTLCRSPWTGKRLGGHSLGTGAHVTALLTPRSPFVHVRTVYFQMRSYTSLLQAVTGCSGYQSHRMTPHRACERPRRTSRLPHPPYPTPPPYTVGPRYGCRKPVWPPTAPPCTKKSINNSL
jgi:hypothetical protein